MDVHHKRSKSKLVKSVLHRASSRQGAQDESADPPEASDSTSQTSIAGSDLNRSLSSDHLSRSSRHRPHLSATMSPPPESKSKSQMAAGYTGEAVNDNPSSPAASLEQSVKMFRIFEALRSGDTTAILKAIKEQNDPSSLSASGSTPSRLEGTTILHLAIQCAETPVIEFVLSNVGPAASSNSGVNAQDKDGNTPLHLAARTGRAPVVQMLLDQDGVNDSILNFHAQTPLDLAYSPEIFQQLQLARSLFIEANVRKVHELVSRQNYSDLEKLLNDPRIRSTVDVNGTELATERTTIETAGTLLHEAARKKDLKLIQLLLMNGADPFRRDRKGKLPQDVTKDEKTRHILKKSPAAEAAQRSVQERTILGGSATQTAGTSASTDSPLGGKESREMKGYLKKWTNYSGGWKLRWFVLEEGVLSYYKHQDDAGAACRGAINMRIARLKVDPQDKLRIEIHGKASVKYHLKANHQVEAKRWYWALNNAIQWTKDEDREEQKRVDRESEVLKQAKADRDKRQARDGDSLSLSSRTRGGPTSSSLILPQTSTPSASISPDNDEGATSVYESSVAGPDAGKVTRQTSKTEIDGEDDDEEYGDYASSQEAKPAHKDALNITAQSVRLQLDLLAHVSASLAAERQRNPSLQFSDATATQALGAYESAVENLKGLIGDFLRIASDRDAYWQYRLDREANIRRMWEESMAKVAKEQEVLESRIGESEDKRKRTKRALRDALEDLKISGSRPATPMLEAVNHLDGHRAPAEDAGTAPLSAVRRKSTFVELDGLSASDSDDDEEFFDAAEAGEVKVVDMPIVEGKEQEVPIHVEHSRESKQTEIEPSFKGYEDPIRQKLKLPADNRPKISLWGILKSMIGKDMTKMTLPVSFNEPTSLLQRVAEDMEYTDLLDTAAESADSTERMVYVATFAASEYASTIGRVAKPFNPLLGETYEYARPDKGYRFFIEQVSHHPPVGAAWAESPRWDYYGESAVKSKFYGKSFDINPLGTWFLRLRPRTGGAELYTWKKVTSSVVGIITGNPVVDNYGTMEVKNWSTGEVCTLEFKPRGWKASSAFIVSGRVLDRDGKTRWSVGGRWNDKIYARLTPGYEDNTFAPPDSSTTPSGRTDTMDSSQAFLVWQANPRPTGIPFNLTPFVVTLNALPDRLRHHLAPTDTRLRPDQRAMEDGEYDLAAVEKNRVEEKQRATRRVREQMGQHFVPRWFEKSTCPITGEEFWKFNGEYWTERAAVANGGKWEGLEDIF